MSARRAALLAALACNPPATGETVPAPPVEAPPPAPTCEEPPSGALALLSPRLDAGDDDRADGTCPWVLVETGGALTLRPLRRSDAPTELHPPLPVAEPPGCRPCRYAGVVTAIGPVLLATRPSADSELAEDAWIGAATAAPRPPGAPVPDGAGPAAAPPATLAFTSLWYGPPVLGDSTLQGPPWSLVPYLCRPARSAPATELYLRPEPRLPGARGEEPDPALVRAHGLYAAAAGELRRQERPVPTDMSLCTRLALELP